MTSLWKQIRIFVWLTLMTGILYPLLITGIAQLGMKPLADGSFVLGKDKKLIGSRLIAQKFMSDKYFWPRPSSIDYNPLPSGGSNLGPTSATLKKYVEDRTTALLKAQPNAKKEEIPSELLYASGSGLDPHISPTAAYFQMERVAKARNKDTATIKSLIDQFTEGRTLGFLGQPRVNVLLLNQALDQVQ